MTNEQRVDTERRIVRGMIRRLKEWGWTLHSGNDGDGGWQPLRLEGEAMELVFSVDESWLRFAKGESQHVVLLIGGNDVDIISDWGLSETDDFDAAMESVLRWIDATVTA
jgi:hypothetical protein